MIFWFFLIFVISFVLAFKSMSDFQIPKEIKKIIDLKKIRGTIIFFKGKIKHYH
ncbi:MAG: hypothetical protein NZM02_02430 [Patescibacteria group bacterium]|nr:hypothetical protein [Patescibacteria group bacterium]